MDALHLSIRHLLHEAATQVSQDYYATFNNRYEINPTEYWYDLYKKNRQNKYDPTMLLRIGLLHDFTTLQFYLQPFDTWKPAAKLHIADPNLTTQLTDTLQRLCHLHPLA